MIKRQIPREKKICPYKLTDLSLIGHTDKQKNKQTNKNRLRDILTHKQRLKLVDGGSKVVIKRRKGEEEKKKRTGED